MTRSQTPGKLQMIPIDQIEVLNPRDRNDRIFEEIVDNIKVLGLKKPVTVTPRVDGSGRRYFLLICGEGRLKAFRALGESTIPAMVVHVEDEDAFIMSLAENIARRQGRTLELLSGIEQLRKQGYDRKTIAKKTGLTTEYIYGILHLLEHGEERLLIAIESGRMPLNVALAIAGAGSNDKDIQAALQDAYEKHELRGGQLLQARKTIERRRTLGRTVARGAPRRYTNVTSASLVRTYGRLIPGQGIGRLHLLGDTEQFVRLPGIPQKHEAAKRRAVATEGPPGNRRRPNVLLPGHRGEPVCQGHRLHRGPLGFMRDAS